jgi:hypothetical protein
MESRHHRVGFLLADHAFVDQALGVDLRVGRLPLDLLVHQRLGERRLVASL